jgi:bifunctional UDP-N-acetylglucosamine pyrophosphorylase/glucosamine-1-phosphate N-acetyltransferase
MHEPTERPLSAIVLAAGHGTRMRSERPKPLHVLVGKPMVVWVLDALADCDVDRVAVVVGHGADAVTKRLVEDAGDRPLEFVEQTVQRGTGDAVAVGLTGLAEDWDEPHDVLVLTGDTPLLRPATIAALVDRHRATDAACTVLTAELPDPTGYGRIVRGRDDRVVRIVEEVDTTGEERAIQEINTGIFCFRRSMLSPALRRIQPDNAQGELYLTDVVGVLADAGHLVSTLVAGDRDETHGINDRVQLAAAEAELRRRINHGWMRAGVTFVDPEQTYVDATVELGRDVTVYPGTMLRGRCVIGAGCDVGPGAHLADTVVGARAHITQTVADRARIGDDTVVGPWAALGPGAEVPAGQVTGPHYADPGTPPAPGTTE